MKMEPTVSSETSAIRTQTPGIYPKRNKLQLLYYYYYYFFLNFSWYSLNLSALDFLITEVAKSLNSCNVLV